MKKVYVLSAFAFIYGFAAAQTKRPMNPSDYLRYVDVSDPQASPDGKWCTYTVSTVDTSKDETDNDIWMVSWDGKENVQLTNTKESESTARFSPDNKYISFLSSRYADDDDTHKDDAATQLWLLNRLGGEARKITDVKNDIEDYVWSPDAKKILLVMNDIDYSDTAESGNRKPYVITRYHFKQDVTGYLDNRKTHLYLLDVATHDIDTLTSGNYNEGDAAWSPDGKKIAFVSNHTEDADKNENDDIFIMDAMQGAIPFQLTTWKGEDTHPQWSPDGKYIAYLQSSSDENFTMYGQNILALISADGGRPNLISSSFDKQLYEPRWSKDGKNIIALMEDDRQQLIASFNIATEKYVKLASGEKVFWNAEMNPSNGDWLVNMTDPYTPNELYALEKNGLRRLTHATDSFLAPLQTIKVEGFQSRSSDGTLVSGILYRPANAPLNTRLPLIMYIHGGPVGQDDYEFDRERNTLAAGGYAVAAVNYRGSSGRGKNYIRAIYGDWGNKEVVDILGAADYLIAQGIADSSRMAIGGWSYGGILTNYTIATTTRFKAAASGAGSSLQLSMYGVDQYVTQYETELGAPWKNADKWIKLSYPFFHADRITTPTLFMASQKDFNVPAAGAEQMYQALKSLGVPTELVIYPNQFHGISVPGYMKDRFERYLDWFGKYLK
ncbi:S9 family peptidase [Parafilimonas sp.]|uniref:S9 family peptidase n=1 Tax=Parafilimonas sp. TaxID=1969739 RepID=UPI0039E4815C